MDARCSRDLLQPNAELPQGPGSDQMAGHLMALLNLQQQSLNSSTRLGKRAADARRSLLSVCSTIRPSKALVAPWRSRPETRTPPR
jgi:hypothetical protein